jgi:hypothetical protein
MQKFFVVLGLAAVLLAPTVIFAAGLIPCDGPDCNACHFAELGQNIIRWLIGIFAVLAGIVFVIAGLKLASAGGNTGRVSEAKGMMTNVVVGLIIMLAAWILINTVMLMVVDVGVVGPWDKIQCVQQPPLVAPPVATSTCPIAALPQITHAEALQIEQNPNTPIWTNTNRQLQACANKFIGKVGGSVTSAYRPPEYQAHLWEVHDRWCARGLSTNVAPECAAVKAAVQDEMTKHSLVCNRPVAHFYSNHSGGVAVDFSSAIAHGSQPVRQAAVESCLNWTLGAADPVHYELIGVCNCP